MLWKNVLHVRGGPIEHTSPLHQRSPILIPRWVGSEKLQPGGESTTYCLWFWLQRPATCCAGCLTASWPWWRHSAHPTSSVPWPAWCRHCWPRAARSSTRSSTSSWINRWVANSKTWHVQQLYLHGKKKTNDSRWHHTNGPFKYELQCKKRYSLSNQSQEERAKAVASETRSSLLCCRKLHEGNVQILKCWTIN